MRLERCVPFLLAVSACNPPLLDERSSKSRVRVDEDRVFTITLPSADRAEPVIRGTAVSFLGRGRDEERGRDLFEFRADWPGEAEILIAPDFRVLIQVWRPEPPIQRPILLRRRRC